jgi:ferric-dicitrate binding protein FerR (iron transport regulator)
MNAADRDARMDADVVTPLREATASLDELHRARLASAIEAALDRDAHAAATARTGVWLRRAGVAAAVAAVAVAFFVRGPRPPRPTPAHPNAIATSAPAASAPALLVPYHHSGDGTSTPSTSLLARPGERVRATIGARVRLTLVGAGRVSVFPVAHANDVELALDSGRLLVDYDGRAGGTLRVRSGGAVTTVVGTLFAVEAIGSGSRVAVARGHVRTQDASGHIWQLAAGDSWSSTDDRLGPIAADLAAALAEHASSWTADTTGVKARHADVRSIAARSAPIAPAAQPTVDLEALYAHAEAAMRARSLADARQTLETIATSDSGGPLGEAALLDLARLSLAEDDREAARRTLARLPSALSDTALAETAEHLRCRADSSTCGSEKRQDARNAKSDP